jgi:putative colanic acid biosynthesis acetyltransferase WcaF
MNETRRVIDLSKAPGQGVAWGRSKVAVYLWGAAELLFVTNPWQPSSRLRVEVLRAFGARIGAGVIFRPRTRVKFPWKLTVGDRSWIGEGVWIHNQDQIDIGDDVVISQEVFLTTGSHAHRKDMALITKPISVGNGTWITSRSLILGGTVLGPNCLVNPLTVVKGQLYDENMILAGNPAVVVGPRFDMGGNE